MVFGRVAALVVACALGATLLSSCASGRAKRASGKVSVVAAEDFWGSIARQLGGKQAGVQSLITNPGTDPHDYGPPRADGRSMASARLVIVNASGSDPWTDRMLDANPVSGRLVLNVGETLGLNEGDNPHQWYSPDSVDKVVDAIGDAY